MNLMTKKYLKLHTEPTDGSPPEYFSIPADSDLGRELIADKRKRAMDTLINVGVILVWLLGVALVTWLRRL